MLGLVQPGPARSSQVQPSSASGSEGLKSAKRRDQADVRLGGSLLINGNRAALTPQIATIAKQEVYRKALRRTQP